MLSDRQCELITAFLDGALSRKERRLALRLLRQSSEARAFLQQLQEDAHALQLLPQRTLPAEFPQRVLNTIRERGLRPPRPTTLSFRPKSTIPAWLGAAIAASILVLVGTGSFLFFGALMTPAQTDQGFVEKPNNNTKDPEPKLNPLIPGIASGVVAEFMRPVEVRVAL